MFRYAALWCFVGVLCQPGYSQGLPATTTVLTHGFSPGSKGVWVQAMAEAILARAGEGSLYRYEGSTGVWTYVPTQQGDGTNNTVVVIFNWVPESASPSPGPNWNYVQAAGDVLYAMLRSPRYAGQSGPADLVSNRFVHFIGHSRGACVTSEAIRRFGLANITIDQYTAHDPHPVNGTLDIPYNYNWNDPVPRRWSNVTWADNYWRADGGGLVNGLDFDGIPLENVHNTMLSETALNCCAYSFAHSDVHLWYHGTIDLGPAPCDGEQCINSQMRNTWWPPGPPIGYTERGYFYSRIGGGSAQRSPITPGVAPEAVNPIYNGEFEEGSHAGWNYHAGQIQGQMINESGNYYARLGASQGGSAATHNRFFLPSNASAIVLDYRVFTAAANHSLRVRLNELGGNAYTIGAIDLAQTTGWITQQSIPLGCSPPRSRVYTLTFEVVAGGTISAVVGIDNITLTTASIVGDSTGDGVVNVNDLLTVINSWGACPAPCPPTCAADVTADCLVNVNDLLAVINNWGACP